MQPQVLPATAPMPAAPAAEVACASCHLSRHSMHSGLGRGRCAFSHEIEWADSKDIYWHLRIGGDPWSGELHPSWCPRAGGAA